PSRLQHPRLPAIPQTHQGRQFRLPASQPRPSLPARPEDCAKGHRSLDAVSIHGRLRHLCDRLAAPGRMGSRCQRWPHAEFRETIAGYCTRLTSFRMTRRENGKGASVKPLRQCQSMLASLPIKNVLQRLLYPSCCKDLTALARSADPTPPAFHKGATKIQVT